jgi:hypothetical protein
MKCIYIYSVFKWGLKYWLNVFIAINQSEGLLHTLMELSVDLSIKLEGHFFHFYKSGNLP